MKKRKCPLRWIVFDAFCIKHLITRPFIIKDDTASSAKVPLLRLSSESFPFANYRGHSNQLMQSNRSLLKIKEFVSALSNSHFSVCFQVQNFFISLHWSKKILSTCHSSSFVIPYSSAACSFPSDRKWRRKEWTRRHSSGKKQTRAVNLDTRNL